MIKNNDAISSYQLSMIIIMTLIGVSAFRFVNEAISSSGKNSWLLIIIYGILNIAAAWLLVSLNRRFPGKTFPEYIQEIIGVIPGKIITIAFVSYVLLGLSYEIREFTEVTKMFLLPNTPAEIIMLALILTCIYVVRGGVECVARVVEITFPLLFIPFVLILIPGLPALDLSNTLPLFRNMTEDAVRIMPDIPHAFFRTEYILFYIGFMRNPKKAYKPVALGLMFVTLFYSLTTLICLSAFGEEAAPKHIWPLLSYIRNINIPGLLIERLDGVTLTIWVVTVFTTLATGYFIASYSLSKIMGTKEQKQYAIPLVIIIYYLALQPDGLAQLYQWGNYVFKYVSGVFMYVIPILLLLIASIRKLGVTENEKA
ncbi:MAG: GerAB/ArcD/ProY family transporter [Bacillota bacterium]